MLVVFALVMLKPVMPDLTDTVAHVFWYSQHMATVHYEDGVYHVHKESVADIKKDASQKNEGLLKKAYAANEFMQVGMLLEKPAYFQSSISFTTTASPLTQRYPLHFYPPPKA